MSCLEKLENVLQDATRLAELRALQILDTPPEEPFDRLTRLSARLLSCPTAMISLVDDHRQFFKSAVGLPEPWATRRQTPLSHSFCKHVVARRAPLIVHDARIHRLLRDNPAIATLGIVAYLGVPLSTRKGATIGSFCVIDTQARIWTEMDRHTMIDLAASVMSEIELRATLLGLKAVDIPLIETRIKFVIQEALHDALNKTPYHQIQDLESYRIQLTSRQRQIFDLMVHGIQTKEIARRLQISPRTVEVHRSQILQRLSCPSLSKLLSQLF